MKEPTTQSAPIPPEPPESPAISSGSISPLEDASEPSLRPKPVKHIGRVLIVGQGAFAQGVQTLFEKAHFVGNFEVVENYLMALGQAKINPPQILIASLVGLGDLARSTATNFKRTAPEAKLLLISGPDEASQAQQAVEAGFDGVLLEPVTPQKLIDVLTETPKPPAIPMTDEPLGDVDLVEKLLNDQKDMPELAMQLIGSQSNLPDLQWVRNGKMPKGHVACTLRYGKKTFGLLTAAASADMDQLAAWAGWLSRWLAMQSKMQGLWNLAMTDPLTGLWNRRYFSSFLKQILVRAQRERFRVTLMVFDIDDFKRYNDTYGHAAGDEILTETARLMKVVMRPHDIVARIGGDEFAVIFWDAQGPRRPNSQHPTSVRRMAKRFQTAIVENRFNKLHHEAPGTLTISGGLAGYPWDGQTADQLLERADQMAFESKRKGKNALVFGAGFERMEKTP